ncbi:MAG: carboxypeptidase regulatory-like domain-containing protein [Candidatus Helarchaeota archaeon]|nr:carboxypeptidase regulatory-like domain-containing protein [Candidatus Helarchaeota archaeon]
MDKTRISGILGILIIGTIVLAWIIFPIVNLMDAHCKVSGTIYENYDASHGGIGNVNVLFVKRPMGEAMTSSVTDADGNFLTGWMGYSGETYEIRVKKSGYYDSQLLWTAPQVGEGVNIFVIAPIGLKKYATSWTFVVRDKDAVTPSDIDNITDQDANPPNVEIGIGGNDSKQDRDEIVLTLIIRNTDLDSVLGCNYHDYVDGKERRTIITMSIEDSNSSDLADSKLLEVVGWNEYREPTKNWYAKQIQPIEFMDDELGEIISGKDGYFSLEVTLDISHCDKLLDGATDQNGITISIGFHDMTNVYAFLSTQNPDPDEVIGKSESYLTLELVDSTGTE